MSDKRKCLLVGCGKMGGALLQHLATQFQFCVIEPQGIPQALENLNGVTWAKSATEILSAFAPDVIILAIKPQQMATTLPAYARFADAVFLSIAAGTPINTIHKHLGDNPSIIRAMTNLPASIGAGVSVAVANAHASPDQRALCDIILRSVGVTAWVKDENLIDAVTAVSGSGPAYVFALCESMTKAGEKIGLPSELAAQLARQTVIGSGALLAQSSESAEQLRKAVTSPGGTTEAGLKELQAHPGLDELINKTLRAAHARARELGKMG